jgi:hypothetical protein
MIIWYSPLQKAIIATKKKASHLGLSLLVSRYYQIGAEEGT